MAYTLCDANGDCLPLRIITPDVHGTPEVKAAFTPHWWACDPCNRSAQRYEVTYHAGQETPTYFAWYELVLPDESPEDIAVKVEHYRLVIAARDAMDDAAHEYRRLTGCGWSAMPPR